MSEEDPQSERPEGMAQLLRAKERKADELRMTERSSANADERRVMNEQSRPVVEPEKIDGGGPESDVPVEEESLAARLRKRRQG